MKLQGKSLLRTGSLLLAGLTMAFSIYGLGFKVTQADFRESLIYYLLCFIAYLFLLRSVKGKTLVWIFLGLGVGMRFMLIFSFPNLSDDIYRFIWDGTLAINGINPFHHLPSYYIENQVFIPGITGELYGLLNSPEYFTIYPPVCQGIFALSCWMFPESWAGSTMVMKGFMFAFECGTISLIIQLLRHFKLPLKSVLIYALNPLVIIEITGNLHFEGAMIFFLLLSILLLVRHRNNLSAIAIALSIASKLLPLIFLPLLIRRLGWKKSMGYFAITGIVLLILFSPLLNSILIQNFGKSLDLYFQKFEFNASIYYVLRWLFQLISGYNQIAIIGPSLGFSVLAGIIIYTIRERQPDSRNLFTAMLFAICLYLFLATTIHPWYTLLPMTLCIFTKFRFPVVWTGLVFLTYINYSYPVYYENLFIVGLEYAVVFIMLFLELNNFKKQNRVII